MNLCTLFFEISENVLLCGDNKIAESLDFQWSPAFVFLSVFICIIYSAIACEMYTKTRLSENTFHIAILKTGITYGIGIFTMHFIGMYALISPGPMRYDLYITVFSLWIAVTGTSLTLLLLYQKHTLFLAAVLFGLTICSMHYSGMLSILSNPYYMHHHIELLIIAVIYAISGSYFALKGFQKYTINHNKRTLFISATVMGITISGMHYLAMTAMEFTPELFPTEPSHGSFISRESIIWFTVLMLLFTISIYINDSLNSERTLTFKKNELELSNENISNSLEKLKTMQNQLIESEKNASMGQLISGIAHEINTPIGICITSASYLDEQSKEFFNKFFSNDITKKDFENYINTQQTSSSLINENLRKASELISVFKQVSVDQDLDTPRAFQLGHFIEELLSSFNHKIKNRDIETVFECQQDFEVNTYAGSLIIILTHLINNSLLHAFDELDKGIITITLSLEEDKAILDYQDNGCGMSEENSKNMLSPFFTTKRFQGSCGLGMNIVYNQATQKLLGQLSCSSSPDKGVYISLSFPRVIESEL